MKWILQVATAIEFTGVNFTFTGNGSTIGDLPTMRVGGDNITVWQLTDEEREEINNSGLVFFTMASGELMYPVFIGSQTSTRELFEDAAKPSSNDLPSDSGIN
jgi:hypothetical protein